MIEKLEYGKSYAIYLNSLYGGYKSNVRIIGKTNIDNVVSNNDDDYNIYKTYFEPVGLGLNSYYSAIKPETTIYIGLVVDSLEPYSYTEEKVFIPKSLIVKTSISFSFNLSAYFFTLAGFVVANSIFNCLASLKL